MTWPAPDLRIDFQNATVSADTHPGAHNDTNLSLNDNYRPEIVRIGNELLTYLPLSGGTLTGDLQVAGTLDVGVRIDADYIRIGDGNSSWPTLSFVNDPYTGIYSAAPWVLAVNKNLQVDGQITDINGPVRSFAIATGIDTADILSRAEVATMPVVDDEGVATTDADVESITVNEVVTALLAKVKQLSARIEALEAAG